MFERLNVAPVFRAHWRSLWLVQSGKPDRLARAALLGAPVAALALSLYFRVQLVSGAALLTALGLLAGTLVGSFTHLSTLRVQIDQSEDRAYTDRVREQFDETAAHLLSAATVAAISAAVIAVGLNIPNGDPDRPTMHFVPSAIATSLGTYVLLVFLISVRRMYAAYIDTNRVSGRLNGFIKGPAD